MLALGRKQQEVVDYLSGTPVERAWLMGQRLEEVKDENPHLGIEYEFSSEENRHQIKLDPESSIQINTRLKVEDEKQERIQHGEEVRFGRDEIVDVNFEPEVLFGEDLEPSELIVKPWYNDWERDVQIEIPGGSFRKELTMTIEDVSNDSVILRSRDPVFRLGIEYVAESKNVDFHLRPDFEDRSIYRISEFLDFTGQLEEYERILVRDLENGDPVLRGEMEMIDSPDETERFREIIKDLDVIESRTGCSFTLTSDFNEDDDLNTRIARDILTEEKVVCPFELTGEIFEGSEEEILQIHEDNEFTEVTVEIEEFEVTIMDQQIPLGDVRFRYPNPELVNAEEIERKAHEPGATPLELSPSEEATIETIK